MILPGASTFAFMAAMAVSRVSVLAEKFRLTWRNEGPISALTKVARKFAHFGAHRLAIPALRKMIPELEPYHRWFTQQLKNLNARRDLVLAEIAAMPFRPTFAVIVNTPVGQAFDRAMLDQTLASLESQLYRDWKAHVVSSVEESSPKDLSGFLEGLLKTNTSDLITFINAGDCLSPDALYEFAKCFVETPGTDFIYCDEDTVSFKGHHSNPFFKPDLAPDHLRCQSYPNRLLATTSRAFKSLNGFRPDYPGAELYDLMLRASEAKAPFTHIRKVLYHAATFPELEPDVSNSAAKALAKHCERIGYPAHIIPGRYPGTFRTRHKLKGNPLVSLLVPTDNRTRYVPGRGEINLLANFVRSLRNSTYRNYELIISDNQNLTEETLRQLEDVKFRRVQYKNEGSKFNLSRKINEGFSHAQGEHLVLLNDDLEVCAPDWIESLLEFSQQTEIGAVGARLLYPDRRVQHAGVIFGAEGMLRHRYQTFREDAPGDHGAALIVRNYAAVTGACMMTRRDVWEKVGGFDENLAIDLNDVNYCASVLELGYRIVYTPYCELYHFEQSTLSGRSQDPTETRLVESRWKKYYQHDPYYNDLGFSLSLSLW